MKALARKLLRYATVSAIATVVSMAVLGVLLQGRLLTAGWANVAATAAGTVPSFELNRRWVWRKAGQRSVLAEVGPFCVLSFAGLGLSTLAVSTAAAWAARSGLGNGARTVAAEGASIVAFGSLWIVQYVVLDRLLFTSRQALVALPADPPRVRGNPVDVLSGR